MIPRLDTTQATLRRNQHRIHTSLTRAWLASPVLTRDIRDLKLVVFSDHHRGGQDGADDFKLCKPAYHAALGYYLEAGFELYLLGDVEELWNVRPEVAIQSYLDTLELEAQFARGRRYKRIWGNHDYLWQHQEDVDRFLHPWLGEETVLESLRLMLTDQDKLLGEFFFVHGHQGTSLSDRYAQFSRPFIRYLFNPLQRLLHYRITTPATNYELRFHHERAMFEWARQHLGLILVTGHTHRPVFTSETHGQYLREELSVLKARCQTLSAEQDDMVIMERIYQKTAELHWVLAQTNGQDPEFSANATPCYFNAGCCSFADGDITGLEIEDGEIRLVRWPDNGHPWKRVLRRAGLKDIFERCHPGD